MILFPIAGEISGHAGEKLEWGEVLLGTNSYNQRHIICQ
jgi:hypothetical protein